jgi:parvulin-like peptidyl-prolyl isomerase
MPSELPMTAKSSIGRLFGPEFAEALEEVATEKWAGPIRSAFGLHIVRITHRLPRRTPHLDEVRNAVAREWVNAKRHEIESKRFERLRQRYQLGVEPYPDMKTVR